MKRARLTFFLAAATAAGCAKLLSLDGLQVEDAASPSNDAAVDASEEDVGTGGGGAGGAAPKDAASEDAETDANDASDASDADAHSDAGDAADAADADAGPVLARPPGRPAGSPVMGGGKTITFAVKSYFFGSIDPASGKADPEAWRKFGYDIDGKCTTAADSASNTPGTCKRADNSDPSTLEDGDDCRDNNFGSRAIHFAAGLDPSIEPDLDANVVAGGSTLMLTIRDLADAPDDPFAPAYLYVASKYSKDGGTPAWDGSDVRLVDPDSLFGGVAGTLMQPKQAFPKAYMNGDVWVSGDFGVSPAHFVLTLNGQPVPIDALTFTLALSLDPTHTKVLDGQMSAVILTDQLVQDLTPAAYALAKCSQAGADVYLNALKNWSDLSANGKNFQDPTTHCDATSLGVKLDWVRVQNPTSIAPMSVDGSPCNNIPDAGADGATDGG